MFKGNGRTTTVTAEADSLVYEIERHVIEPLLDVRLDLREQLEKDSKAQSQRIKDGWKGAAKKKAARKASAKEEKKSPVTKVMQTFFPAMFEENETEKPKESHEKPKA